MAVSANQDHRTRQSHKGRLKTRMQMQSNKESKMANEKTNSNEYTAQAVAKAARVAIQTISIAGAARAENMGPRMNSPIMKQPTFNLSSKDK